MVSRLSLSLATSHRHPADSLHTDRRLAQTCIQVSSLANVIEGVTPEKCMEDKLDITATHTHILYTARSSLNLRPCYGSSS